MPAAAVGIAHTGAADRGHRIDISGPRRVPQSNITGKAGRPLLVGGYERPAATVGEVIEVTGGMPIYDG